MGFISDLLSRKAIDVQARDLAGLFKKRLPKERVNDLKRVAAELDILLVHARGYQRKLKLGVVGTSRLVNGFQWALIEDGYSSDFARDVGKQLAVKLAASS